MEWPKKVFFLCYIAIAGVSSPNCGDKVEVQLLFMAFNIWLIYMSDLDDIDFTEEQLILELSNKVDKLEENLKIGLGCKKPDPPEVCSKMKGGKRKRKSRKKRGKGSMISRKKKNISARQPKEKYVDDALKQLVENPEWIRAGVVVQVKMMRDLAFELEDADKQKKGGRKKRKSRRKTKKRRRSKRRKSRRKRR